MTEKPDERPGTLDEMTRLRERSFRDKPSSMGRLQVIIWKQAVSVLCALALMLVAFAHRPLETDPRLSDPQIAAYLALGGSFADLCLSGDGGEDHAAHADCPACTIAKSMALAPALLWWCSAAGYLLPSLPRLTGGLARAHGCATSSRSRLWQ